MSHVEATYRKLMKAGCTGCRYCVPCPYNVDIPVCFEQFNIYHMFGNKKRTKMLYPILVGGTTDGKPGLASQCTRCGECVELCPQNLPIPELLDEVKKEMEGVMTKPLIWMGRKYLTVLGRRAMRKAKRLEKQS